MSRFLHPNLFNLSLLLFLFIFQTRYQFFHCFCAIYKATFLSQSKRRKIIIKTPILQPTVIQKKTPSSNMASRFSDLLFLLSSLLVLMVLTNAFPSKSSPPVHAHARVCVPVESIRATVSNPVGPPFFNCSQAQYHNTLKVRRGLCSASLVLRKAQHRSQTRRLRLCKDQRRLWQHL